MATASSQTNVNRENNFQIGVKIKFTWIVVSQNFLNFKSQKYFFSFNFASDEFETQKRLRLCFFLERFFS